MGVRRAVLLVYVGKVGTGYGDKAVRGLLPHLKSQEAKDSPFGGMNAPKKSREFHWVKPVLVAEIEFAGWTGNDMVMQAAFKGLRDNKPAAEVKAERIAPAKSTPLATANQTHEDGYAWHTGKTQREFGNGRHRLQSVEGCGRAAAARPVTQFELTRYYKAVGQSIMQRLKGRPCSIIRAPDGIDGEKFFQRHAMAGSSNLLELVRSRGPQAVPRSGPGRGTRSFSPIAAVELHPWNCESGQPELPGRFVFDLDPAPDLHFDAVIEGALELKAGLEALDLIPFCKTRAKVCTW